MQPPSDEVRLQLDRILASGSFASADRLSRFLRYVVERTLAGEGDRLKEYVIGREVFDRDERYDPRIDSIVRVEAGRLRAKIDEYYNRHGVNDAVIIRVRRGSYVPVFELRKTESSVPLPAEGWSLEPAGKPSRWDVRIAAIGVTLLLVAIAAWRAGPWAPRETEPAGVTMARWASCLIQAPSSSLVCAGL